MVLKANQVIIDISNRFELNKYDWKSLGLGLLDVMIGSAVSAGLDYVMKTVSGMTFGNYTFIVLPVVTWLVKLGRKLLDGPVK